jgi:nucleotide-binding universal stress UspA family protein
MFDKILVAIDDSEYADKVLATAAEFAATFGAELRVVHVMETEFVGKVGMINLESSDVAHKIVTEAVAWFTAKGLTATGEVRAGLHGRLAREIDQEARDFGARLIVVGSRGLTDLEGLLLGSTTHRLMHVTKLPVLVVP